MEHFILGEIKIHLKAQRKPEKVNEVGYREEEKGKASLKISNKTCFALMREAV